MAPSRKRTSPNEKNAPDSTASTSALPSTSSSASKKPKLIQHPSHGQTEGQVLTFGTGDTGQLGLGETMERKKPALVKIELEDGLIEVCGGGMHTIALSKSGRVFSWGCNDEGSLGRLAPDGTALSEDDDCAIPGEVLFPEGTLPILQTSAGDSHSAALTADGKVYFWGGWRDNSGIMTEKFPAPHLVDLPVQVLKVASGCHHLIFLTINGQVYSMGCGENGQLGRLQERFATRNARHWKNALMTPALVPLKYAFKKGLHHNGLGTAPPSDKIIATNTWAGGFTSMVQLESGHVLGFGLNSVSQLGMEAVGTNEETCVYQPRLLPSISNLEVSDVSCGHHHSLILTKGGQVYACGLKQYGALGTGGVEGLEENPVLVELEGGVPAVKAAAGTHKSFAVTANGSLFSWGTGTNNALGHGDDEDKEEPEIVTSKQLETRNVVSVSSGGQHTVILAVGNHNNNNGV